MARNADLKLPEKVIGSPHVVSRKQSAVRREEKPRHKIIQARDEDFIEINPDQAAKKSYRKNGRGSPYFSQVTNVNQNPINSYTPHTNSSPGLSNLL